MINISKNEKNIYNNLIIIIISLFLIYFIASILLIKINVNINNLSKNILNCNSLILLILTLFLLFILFPYLIFLLIIFLKTSCKIYKNYNFYLKNEQNINLSKDSFKKILKYSKYQKYCIIFYIIYNIFDLIISIFLNLSINSNNEVNVLLNNDISLIAINFYKIIFCFILLYFQYLKMRILKKENIYI